MYMYTVERRLFELARETKIGSKNRLVGKIEVNLQCLTEERERLLDRDSNK